MKKTADSGWVRVSAEDLLEKLADGRLPRETAEACAARMIRVIWQTLGMEDAPAYGAQYPNMPYIKVKG